MNQAILELARTVRQRPTDADALQDLMAALRDDGDLPALVAVIECWAATLAGAPRPTHAMTAFYTRLAEQAAPDTARKLCLAALDLTPGHAEALARFEQLAGPEHLNELCRRYRAFLGEAPFHALSPRVRVKLVDRLVEAGRYDEALEQVKTLPPPSSMNPGADDIARACSIAPPPPIPPEALRGKVAEGIHTLDYSDIQFVETDPVLDPVSDVETGQPGR